MDELTKLIKTEIKKQFRSVRQFSMYIGVPQSTIVTALQKGIGGTSFETIMHICDVLDIFGQNVRFCEKTDTHVCVIADVNERAEEMLFQVEKQMAKDEGVDEALKRHDQLDWVQRMNSIRSRAEEMVINEFIYY